MYLQINNTLLHPTINPLQLYNFVQAIALVMAIIFGFALFTYAFNSYAEASRRHMAFLREKYEALATRNAILAFAGVKLR